MSNAQSTMLDRIKRRAHDNPVVVGLILVAVVLGGVAGLKSSFDTLAGWLLQSPEPVEQTDATKPERPPPTMSNAFKVGYSLSHLIDPRDSSADVATWGNRAAAHLEGLGLEFGTFREIAEAGSLSRQDYADLVDQLKARIEATHGAAAASTFVVGTELLPVTDALVAHYSDAEYRAGFEGSSRHIGEILRNYNLHVYEAHLPKRVGGSWRALFKGAVNTSSDSRFGVEYALHYRDCIVAYYYEWPVPPGPFSFAPD